MGVMSRRKKETGEFTDQKWEYISLNDFKARGCGPGFAYFWLWLLLFISVAVYATDSFIAVNLLILDQWSSKIEPGIPYDVSKWVFSACILLSFVNLGYEAWRAYRVMKRGNVAECYLDPLAVRWESIRMGQGQGWKRFLVFAELTKSKKGAEYAALFTYFSLQAWIRVLVCSGPRQVINAFTFKDVYESKLLVSSPSVEGSLAGFFEKIGALYEEDYQQAVVLTAMAFTFVVWVFGVIFLIVAVVIYLTFLCHWIPRADGGLRGYCERKVNQTLKKIVTQKVNRALAKGETNRLKAGFMAARANGEPPTLDRVATLPTLPNVDPNAAPPPISRKRTEDSLPEMPMLGRNETTTTLPVYSSRPASPGGIEMSAIGASRPAPRRTGTMASTTTNHTYSSQTSLLGGAADMGRGRPSSPEPTLPNLDLHNIPPREAGTPASRGGFGSHPEAGVMAGAAIGGASRQSPAPRSMNSYGQQQGSRDHYPPPRHYQTYNPEGRASPAPSSLNQRSTPQPRHNDGYHRDERDASHSYGAPPYQASRSATGPPPSRGPYGPPQRNMTAPMPPRGPNGGSYERSLTPQGRRPPPPQYPQGYDRAGTPGAGAREGPYGYDMESQRNNGWGY